MKYSISCIELYKREQWNEKGFVFNLLSLVFSCLNLMTIFFLIYKEIKRKSFPLYIIGDAIDYLIKIYKGLRLFCQARALINKLKALPDVKGEDLPDKTCIICFENIDSAKKL